ncbi:TPA: hypothetical protein SMT55_000892 [Proteus mirabilis]|nr:hypothetical protein [Proteus mirabilis]HEK2723304.1 hypothetical protein [Proteus mirabilis]
MANGDEWYVTELCYEMIWFNGSRVQISSKKDEITNFEEVKRKNIEKRRDRVMDKMNRIRYKKRGYPKKEVN